MAHLAQLLHDLPRVRVVGHQLRCRVPDPVPALPESVQRVRPLRAADVTRQSPTPGLRRRGRAPHAPS
eukprot:1999590-Prymnesium_polylepis.1